MVLTRGAKKLLLLLVDAFSVAVGAGIAYLLLMYYIVLPPNFFVIISVAYFMTYISMGCYFHVFSKINRFFNMRDMRNLVVANLTAGIVTLAISIIFFDWTSVRYVFLLTVFAMGIMAMVRLFWRAYIEGEQRREYSKTGDEPRLLIVGAGKGGNIFIKSFHNQPNHFNIVGIIDNDPDKQNSYIEGVPVLGKTKEIPKLVKKYQIEMITITAPSMTGEDIEEIIDLGNQVDVVVNQMPAVETTLGGYQVTKPNKEIEIADLLGREEVKLDNTAALEQIRGKRVLVTGAGGSIGSEIVRQIAKFFPEVIYLLGHGENSIYLIHQEMRALNLPYTNIVPVIADVQDREHMFNLMQQYKPHIVYHAAAHKHVPLMEANPQEAVKNNVFGTRNVAEAAKAAGVEVFVMVSTDKANNPPNVMGATKRIAEMIVTGMNDGTGTIFTAVRFGNVLGSRGSVIPVFKRQIAQGGPVTVTDFRMTRFFMTIPEASRLVIQAGALAQGGELFILDMGEEIKILDLAKKMIKLSGFTEDEIQIIETGIRPGEKLYEELLLDDETTGRKVDDKIFVGKVQNMARADIDAFINALDLSGESKTIKQDLVAFVHRGPDKS